MDDLDALEGKVALVRVDFNVPLADGEVRDDTRLRASLTTVRELARRGAVVLLLSHFGRPNGKPRPEFSLSAVLPAYRAILGRDVRLLENWTKPSAKRAVSAMRPGGVALLENTRFYPR